MKWRTQHNDSQTNGTQYNDTQHNNRHYNVTRPSILLCWVAFMLSVANKPIRVSFVVLSVVMLNVGMLSVDMLSVVAPVI